MHTVLYGVPGLNSTQHEALLWPREKWSISASIFPGLKSVQAFWKSVKQPAAIVSIVQLTQLCAFW